MAWARRTPSTLNRQHLDRGRRQGARWCYVTPQLQMIDYTPAGGTKALADEDEWILFRSKREAKRWIWLSIEAREGRIQNLRRQVRYPLLIRRPDGLDQKIGAYVADFVYDRLPEEPFAPPVTVVEDVKGYAQDVYKLKKKIVEAFYAITIVEV